MKVKETKKLEKGRDLDLLIAKHIMYVMVDAPDELSSVSTTMKFDLF